jgi:signal transduction histidine kinase
MTQMKQLFVNIINNSIKFRKPYVQPIISIEASIMSSKEKANANLSNTMTYHKIQITDNGIGFENEYANKIFQVFQRLHGKSEYPGSGIGLAICKKIVEHHHGIIFAENIPGCGARFTFILPEQQAGS